MIKVIRDTQLIFGRSVRVSLRNPVWIVMLSAAVCAAAR